MALYDVAIQQTNFHQFAEARKTYQRILKRTPELWPIHKRSQWKIMQLNIYEWLGKTA